LPAACHRLSPEQLGKLADLGLQRRLGERVRSHADPPPLAELGMVGVYCSNATATFCSLKIDGQSLELKPAQSPPPTL